MKIEEDDWPSARGYEDHQAHERMEKKNNTLFGSKHGRRAFYSLIVQTFILSIKLIAKSQENWVFQKLFKEYQYIL